LVVEVAGVRETDGGEVVQNVDAGFGGGDVGELHFVLAAGLRVPIFEFLEQVKQRVVGVLQKGVEIKLGINKHEVESGLPGVGKLFELVEFVHVLLCNLVAGEFVVEVLVEEVVVRLFPDVQEGALDPGGNHRLAECPEVYLEASGTHEVLPLGLQPCVLHYLPASDASHACEFGQT